LDVAAAPPGLDPQEGSREAPAPADVAVVVPDADRSQRNGLALLAAAQRDELAQVLGVERPRITVRVHDTTEAFERATGAPWFTLGAVARGEGQLVPLWVLRERGMLETTLRRLLVHVMTDPLLRDRAAWVREGAASYFADPQAHVATRQACPSDIELQRPTSVGALADALMRARACFEREVSSGRDWRRVR
jgi:hypothetical protein